MADSRLLWVIVDGIPRRATDFAAMPPRRRPQARCPECDRPVILKLGRIRQHHAAHVAGDACTATAPETALHLAAKFALAHVLRSMAGAGSRIRVVQRCAGVPGEDCEAAVEKEWIREWDEVRVERSIGGARRPDVVLRRDGRDIAGIELLATHAVPDEKVAALAAIQFPWVEVRATPRLAAAAHPSDAEPLPVVRESAGEQWRCDAHSAVFRRLTEERRERAAAAADARRHTTALESARVVDIYHRAGGRERHIYRIERLSTDGVAHTLRLMRGGLEIASVPAHELDTTEAAATLQLAFRTDVNRLSGRGDSIADSPMRWASGGAAADIVEEALLDTVGADPTPLASRFPRRWFFASRRGEWFLPVEMRDVRWDRPEGDAFAPHPAWVRARGGVRERPVAEAMWDTAVFAARPVGALMAQHVRGARLVEDDERAQELCRIRLQRHDGCIQWVVVAQRAVADDVIEAMDALLHAGKLPPIWISHPLDWRPALLDAAWAPAGRDPRGRSLVVVDGVGVFRAAQFLRALIAGDARLRANDLRARLAARVGSLAARCSRE